MYGYYYKAGKTWEDVKLWEATKDNPQEDINVESFLNQDNYWNIGSFKELAKEMQLVLKADYSHPINRWHKVEDELPPRIKETVNVSKTVIVSNGLSYGIGYYNYNLNKWFCVGITNITHWMELSELPKEE